MNWREQLLDARLNGVAFFVREHSRTSGRRLVVHEYPFQDQPDSEDMGARPVRFQIDAYVVGEDYQAARDALLAQLDAPGTKRLVHPWLGELTVAIDGEVSMSETTREGGMATLRFVCLRIDELGLGRFVAVDSQQAVLDSAAAVDIAAAGQIEANLQPSAYDTLQGVFRSVQSAFKGVEKYIDIVVDYGDLAIRLAQSPAAIYSRIVTDLARLGAVPLRVLAAFRTGLFNDRGIDTANNLTIEQAVQTAACAALARLSAATDYASYDEAVRAREQLLDLIEAVQMEAGDEVYLALANLRAAVATDIGTRAADLRRIIRITLLEATPALVLAQKLYGPAGAEAAADEICVRNGIDEPLFVPDGVELELLAP